MKKLFIAVLAVAGLASCMQDEVLSQDQAAIEFGDAFVDNATKAIYEGSTEVDEFKVWGTVKGEGEAVALYNGATVTRGTDADHDDYNEPWTCTVTRFWTPNCNYAFYAVVDAADDAVDAPNGVPTSIEYTADGTTDLLYGATTKTTKPDLTVPATPLVAFNMQHLLSKITFKVTNPESNGDYSYNVKSITVSGAYASGTYTFADTAAANANTGTWVPDTGAMNDLSFTGTTALESTETYAAPNAYVIIPGNPVLTITIVTETVFGGEVVSPEQTHTLSVNNTGDMTKITFAKNVHYNFGVILPAPGAPIEFTISEVDTYGTPQETPIQ